MRGILARFEVVSGLKINLLKSELVPIGIVPKLEELVEILGCRQSSLPLKYLGLPLGATHKEENLEPCFGEDEATSSWMEEVVFI